MKSGVGGETNNPRSDGSLILKGFLEGEKRHKGHPFPKGSGEVPDRKDPKTGLWLSSSDGSNDNRKRGEIRKLVSLPGKNTLEAITLREYEAW